MPSITKSEHPDDQISVHSESSSAAGVGVFVGEAVGALVGKAVGKLVGLLVGAMVGAIVGCSVGTTTGAQRSHVLLHFMPIRSGCDVHMPNILNWSQPDGYSSVHGAAAVGS
jgi:hypothetical protein